MFYETEAVYIHWSVNFDWNKVYIPMNSLYYINIPWGSFGFVQELLVELSCKLLSYFK